MTPAADRMIHEGLLFGTAGRSPDPASPFEPSVSGAVFPAPRDCSTSRSSTRPRRSTSRRWSRRSSATIRWTKTTDARAPADVGRAGRRRQLRAVDGRHPTNAADGSLAPRNIFQTEGFTDTYAPNPHRSVRTALGGDRDAARPEGVRMTLRAAASRRRRCRQPRRRQRRARAVQASGRLRRSLRRVRRHVGEGAIGRVPRYARQERHRVGRVAALTWSARSSASC